MLHAIFEHAAYVDPSPSRFRRLNMRKASRRARLRLERLEGRCPPAIFTVNTLADTDDQNLFDGAAEDANGDTSLRAAIQQANAPACPGQDIIEFAGNLNGTIELTKALELDSNIFIDGPGTAGGFRITVTRAAA